MAQCVSASLRHANFRTHISLVRMHVCVCAHEDTHTHTCTRIRVHARARTRSYTLHARLQLAHAPAACLPPSLRPCSGTRGPGAGPACAVQHLQVQQEGRGRAAGHAGRGGRGTRERWPPYGWTQLGVVGVGREEDGHLMAGRSWVWCRTHKDMLVGVLAQTQARAHTHTRTHADIEHKRTGTLSLTRGCVHTHTHTHTHTPPWDHAESVAQSQGNGCPRRSFSHVTPAHARTPPPPGVRARRVQVHLEAAASEGAIPHLCRMAVAGVAASADPTTVAALKAASARSSAAGGGEQFTPVGASVRAFTPGGSSVRAFTPGCSGVRAFTPGVSGLCAFTPGGRSVLWTTRCELCPDCSAPPPTLPAGTSACSSARFRRGTLALARLPVGACCPCPLPSPPGSALAITTALAGMRWLALLSMPADVHCSHAHAHARLLPPPTAPPATLPPTALAHAQPPLPLPLPAAAARAVCCCRRAATLGLRARFCGAHAGGHGVVLASDARAHVERGRPGRPAGAARGTPGGGPGSSVCAHVHVCACAHACIYACVHVEPCVRATSTTHIHKRALLPAPACAQHYHAVPAAGRHAPLCIPPPPTQGARDVSHPNLFHKTGCGRGNRCARA